VAQDFGSSLGLAASIVTAYAIPDGTTQVFAGLIGDRAGAAPLFVLMALLWPALALWVRIKIGRRGIF
jgi:MFS family permease